MSTFSGARGGVNVSGSRERQNKGVCFLPYRSVPFSTIVSTNNFADSKYFPFISVAAAAGRTSPAAPIDANNWRRFTVVMISPLQIYGSQKTLKRQLTTQTP